jgi:geranylgeranyl diphosphate synthase, type II
MLIHLLSAAPPPDRDWLVRFLGRPAAERTAADVQAVSDLMERHGSIDFALDYGHGVAAAAHAALPAAFAGVPESSHLAFIRARVPYMLERTR